MTAALAGGRHKESCATDEKNERQNSPLPFADKCGTINQEEREQMPCSHAITLWRMRQIQNSQHLFANRLRLILKGPHWSIGRPTDAQTISRMLLWKSMRWKWTERGSLLALIGICLKAYWSMWNIWKVPQAEIRRCNNHESILASAPLYWHSASNYPLTMVMAEQSI